MLSCSYWMDLLVSLGAPRGHGMVQAFGEIAEKYCSPERRYHTLEHIDHCLSEAQRIRFLFSRPGEAILALILHDIVYTPGADDNEKRSARLAKSMLTNIGVPDGSIRLVSRMIIATTYHIAGIRPETPDEELIVDVDFSSLGKPEKAFTEDEKLIEKEYEVIPRKKYCRGRAAFIRSILKRPAIFHTKHFRERYEEQAKRNLENSLERISKELDY